MKRKELEKYLIENLVTSFENVNTRTFGRKFIIKHNKSILHMAFKREIEDD